MLAYMLVAGGGALGAMARRATMVFLVPSSSQPYATFSVNIAGCLLAGFLTACLAGSGDRGEGWRLFLGVGFLGGYTTFSAFSIELVTLAEEKFISAATYAAASVMICTLAAFIGIWLGRALLS